MKQDKSFYTHFSQHFVWKDTVDEDQVVDVKSDEEIVQQKKSVIKEMKSMTEQQKIKQPGSCKTCGQLGHLTYQCRNQFRIKRKEGILPASKEIKGQSQKEEVRKDQDNKIKEKSREKNRKKNR